MNPVRPGGSGIQDIMALRQEVLARSQSLKDVRAATTAADKVAGPDTAKLPAGDFADTLGDALKQVSATPRKSSDMQAAYERGEVTDIAQVMIARQESSVAFEATLQVRNRLITAYQEIMRMGS